MSSSQYDGAYRYANAASWFWAGVATAPFARLKRMFGFTLPTLRPPRPFTPKPTAKPLRRLSRVNWYVAARLPVHLLVPLFTVPGALPAMLFWMVRMLLLMFVISAGSSVSPRSFFPWLT